MKKYFLIAFAGILIFSGNDESEANNIDEERLNLLEDEIELVRMTRTQDVLNAFDQSSFAHELVSNVRELRDEVTGARIEIGKGAATLESLENSLKENQRKVNLNTDSLNILSNKMIIFSEKIPVIENRVGILEVRAEKRSDSRRAAYLDMLGLFTVGTVSWIASFFYKKYRALKRGRRADD